MDVRDAPSQIFGAVNRDARHWQILALSGLFLISILTTDYGARPMHLVSALAGTMTAQIIDAINENLGPRGAAVMLEAEHMCMTMRGVKAHDVKTVTHRFTGVFAEDRQEQDRFFPMVGHR